jgi:hypothetical protein
MSMERGESRLCLLCLGLLYLWPLGWPDWEPQLLVRTLQLIWPLVSSLGQVHLQLSVSFV